MEKQGLNLAPWLVTILSLCIASLSGWLYFSATTAATAQQAELSTSKQRFLTETKELRSQLSKLQRQRDSAQQTTSSLQNQLQQLTEQLKTSEGKHQQLVNTHNGEIAALRESANSARETGKANSNTADQILSERDQAVTELETLKKAYQDFVSQSNEKIAQLTTEKEGILTQRNEKATEFEMLKAKTNTLELKLLSAKLENKRLTQKVSNLEAGLDSTNTKSEQFKIEKSTLRSQLNDTTSKHSALTLEHEKQEAELLSAHAAHEQLKSDNETLTIQYQERLSEIKALKLTVSELASKPVVVSATNQLIPKLETSSIPSAPANAEEVTSVSDPLTQSNEQPGVIQTLSTPPLSQEEQPTPPEVIEEKL